MPLKPLREECIVQLILMGTTTTLFNGKLCFFIQHLFYHFSPLNHLFFNIAACLIISQAWKNNCLAISDLYPLCLDQQREINNKLLHRGIGHYSNQLLGAHRARMHHCAAKSELLRFQNLLQCIQGKTFCILAQKSFQSYPSRQSVNWCRIMVVFVTIDLVHAQYQILSPYAFFLLLLEEYFIILNLHMRKLSLKSNR